MTHRSFALVACLAVLCLWPARLDGGADQPQQGPASPPPPPAPPGTANPEEWQRQYLVSKALQLHGMVEAAKVNGGEYAYGVDMSGANLRNKPATLRALVQLAPLIIVGRVESASPFLSEDRSYVMTSYEIAALDTVKGSAIARLSVRIIGGRLELPDGTVVEVRTPGFGIEVGKRYVFCIRPADDGTSTDPAVKGQSYYLLSFAGSQGIVDVSGERITSLTGAKLPIRAVLDGKTTTDFLAELRTAIRDTAATPRANPK